mgnify:CR=1
MYVQFSDSTKSTIIAIYASPQPLLDNVYELDTSTDAYKTFYGTMPGTVQQSIPSPE